MQTEVFTQWTLGPCTCGAHPLHTFPLALGCCKSSRFEKGKAIFKETVKPPPLFTGEQRGMKEGYTELTAVGAPRPPTPN